MFRALMCLIKRSGKKKIHRENKISNPKLKASRNFWVSNLAKSDFSVLRGEGVSSQHGASD